MTNKHLHQRAPDGFPVGADDIMKRAYGPIPEAAEFQHGGGRARPIEVHGWQWSNDFGCWSALVTFEDGTHTFTYPVHQVHTTQLSLMMPEDLDPVMGNPMTEQNQGVCSDIGIPISEPIDINVIESISQRWRIVFDKLLSTGPQLDMELARRAHSWTSFTPEKRAEQARQEYEGHLTWTYETLTPLATTEAQHTLLIEEITRYMAGYQQRYHAMLEAKSRTASPMVTGPANFPTARNQKRMETERRRGDELLDWQEHAFKAIERAILGARTVDQMQEDEWQKLKRNIDRNMATAAEIDSGVGRFAGFNRTAFVISTTDKLRRMAENGEADLVTRALTYIREQQEGMRKPFITDRNSIWTVLETVETRNAEAPPTWTGEELIAGREGLRAVRNYDVDRLQIFFDDKPTAEVREQLKRSGWNWSPSQGAWQRKITPNAEYALRQFLDGQAMPREVEEALSR